MLLTAAAFDGSEDEPERSISERQAPQGVFDFEEGQGLREMFTELWGLASRSRDPSTQNAAMLYRQGGGSHVFAVNDFTDGFPEDEGDFERPRKYQLMEHAERAVIAEAARRGIPTQGTTMVALWAACPECARMIVRAGVRNVITLRALQQKTPSRWQADVSLGKRIMLKAGVKLAEFSGGLYETGVINFDGAQCRWTDGQLHVSYK